MKADLFRDRDAQFPLEREQTVRPAVIRSRPDLYLIASTDQPRQDAQLPLLETHGTLNQVFCVQLATDIGLRFRCSFVGHDGRTANDAQTIRIDFT